MSLDVNCGNEVCNFVGPKKALRKHEESCEFQGRDIIEGFEDLCQYLGLNKDIPQTKIVIHKMVEDYIENLQQQLRERNLICDAAMRDIYESIKLGRELAKRLRD